MAIASLAGSEDIAARLDIVELFAATTEYADHAFAAEWAYTAYQDTQDRALEDRALRNLGPLWLDIDDLVRARNALDKLLDYKLTLEEQAIVHAFRGRIDMRRRNFESAREQFEVALRLSPAPSAGTRRDYAHFLEWTGDVRGALAQFQQAAAAGDVDDALALVEAAQRLDTPATASRVMSESRARFPADRALRLAHARAQLTREAAAARRELAMLDDGSQDPSALMAAALLGRAREAATPEPCGARRRLRQHLGVPDPT